MAKMFMFFAFVWMVASIAGMVMVGGIAMATTTLTTTIDDDDTTINVTDTDGFTEAGIIVIEDEHIAYSNTTATTFTGTLARPMIRGTSDTDATVHTAGAQVRTVESSMMNQAAAYNVAVIADSSGVWSAVTISLAVLRLIGNYITLPVSFMGTDLQIIAYIWWVGIAGMLLAFGIALAGGRRV